MDLPVHIAAGAFLGNVILYADVRFSQQPPSQKQRIELGIACFLLGVLSHLFLDAMPHYDWLFYVKIFSPLPFWWILPQILVSFPALLITFYYTRDSWIIAMVSVLGGIYPDIEKLAYVDFHLPQYFVLFRNHSCALSQWTPWEQEHKTFLIVFEVCVFFVLLAGIYWAACCRKQLKTESLWYKNKEKYHCFVPLAVTCTRGLYQVREIWIALCKVNFDKLKKGKLQKF